MPPVDVVRAQVVDIRADTPRATDRTFLDTNVWAWLHYFVSGFSATGALIPQAAVYAPYARQLGDVGAIRYRAGLSSSELARLIEENELEGYASAAGRMPL